MTRARLLTLAFGGVAIAIAIVVGGLALLRSAVSGPGLVSRTRTHDVGQVVQGTVVEHSFILANDEAVDVRIDEVVPWAGEVVRVDSILPAGGDAQVAIRLDTRGQKGPINELVKVRFAGEGRLPLWLQLRGRVVLPVQVAPQEHVYFFSVRGQAPEEVLEVVNHQDVPLRVLGVRSSNPLFKVKAETVDEGQRYALTVSLDPAAPPGQHESAITVTTDSPDYPAIDVVGWARVKDVVSVSVSEVYFSRFSIESLNMRAVARRTVLVEKHEATDFQVLRGSTEIPFMDVEIEPQEEGRSFLVHVTIVESRAERGAFSGMLLIETNDPDFPHFELPIHGAIL